MRSLTKYNTPKMQRLNVLGILAMHLPILILFSILQHSYAKGAANRNIVAKQSRKTLGVKRRLMKGAIQRVNSSKGGSRISLFQDGFEIVGRARVTAPTKDTRTKPPTGCSTNRRVCRTCAKFSMKLRARGCLWSSPS